MTARKLIFVVGFSQPSSLFKEFASQFEAFAEVETVSSAELALKSLESGKTYTEHLAEHLSSKASNVLIGWSLGGVVCLETTARCLNKIEALVLISSTSCFLQKPDYKIGVAPKSLQALIRGISGGRKETMDKFIRTMFDEGDKSNWFPLFSENARSLSKELLLDNLEYLKADIREVLPQIRVPTLLIHGGRDRVISFENSVYCSERITGASLKRYEESSHIPFLEETKRIVSDILVFLDMV